MNKLELLDSEKETLLELSFDGSDGSIIPIEQFEDSNIMMDVDIYPKYYSMGNLTYEKGYKSKSSKIKITVSVYKQGAEARELLQNIISSVINTKYIREKNYDQGWKEVQYITHRVNYKKGSEGMFGSVSIEFIDKSGLWTSELNNYILSDIEKNRQLGNSPEILFNIGKYNKLPVLGMFLQRAIYNLGVSSSLSFDVSTSLVADMSHLIRNTKYILLSPKIYIKINIAIDDWILVTDTIKYYYYYIGAEEAVAHKGQFLILDFLSKEFHYENGDKISSPYGSNSSMEMHITASDKKYFYIITRSNPVHKILPQYQYTL